MAEDFDPYYKWLGIPPEEQPPNHYRLLGVRLFESDREVIDSVANRHIAYLQDITAGPHLKQAQKLLTELAAARRTLLNEGRKTKYDAALQEELAPPAASVAPTAVPVAQPATGSDSSVRSPNSPSLLRAQALEDTITCPHCKQETVEGGNCVHCGRSLSKKPGGGFPGINTDDSSSGIRLNRGPAVPKSTKSTSARSSGVHRLAKTKKKNNTPLIALGIGGGVLALIALTTITFMVTSALIKPSKPKTPGASPSAPDAPNPSGGGLAGTNDAPVMEISSFALAAQFSFDDAKKPFAGGILQPTVKGAPKRVEDPDRAGGVIQLNGKADQLKFDRPMLSSSVFSIVFYVKTDKAGPTGEGWTSGAGLLDSSVKDGKDDFGVSLLGDKVAFGVGLPRGKTIKSKTSITDGKWHHMTAIYANGKMQLYIDGKREVEASTESGEKSGAAHIAIGSLQTDKNYFQGSIDDVRFYNLALTDGQIRGLLEKNN